MKKFNWGHGIFLIVIIGIIGVLALVFASVRQQVDLVSEEYYPKGLAHDKQMEKERNAAALQMPITVDVEENVRITFPEYFSEAAEVNGEVWFYRPSDKNADLKDSIQLKDSRILSYPTHQFKSGKYDLIIDWNYQGKTYYFKQAIVISKD